jgi:hypothetical protein
MIKRIRYHVDVVATLRNGQKADLQALAGMRVKNHTKTDGSGIVVILDTGHGKRGVSLRFASIEDYKKCLEVS